MRALLAPPCRACGPSGRLAPAIAPAAASASESQPDCAATSAKVSCRSSPGRRLLLFLGGASASPLLHPSPEEGFHAKALALDPDERQAATVFRKATPGVVSVARSWRPGERKRRESAEDDGLPNVIGSGFLWDENHVVTNYHVVKEAGKGNLSVVFLEGVPADYEMPRRRVYEGQLVGSDPATDTAVLRVGRPIGQELRSVVKSLDRGTSKQLEVGQTVYAIGNPFGLEHSMSRGIISGIARTLEIGERPIRGCIQTDASINPGNSGGPLLDSKGRVIGVNTAILTGSGTSAGVGLAIPVDTVTRNVEAILKQGFVTRAFLGITFAADEVSEQLQLPGIIVMAVVPDSPAAKAGVKPMRKGVLGDVITALDSDKVRTGADLFRLLEKYVPGDNISFRVQRAKRGVDDEIEELALNITLSNSKPRA